MSLVMVRAFNLRCDTCDRLFVLAGTSLFWADKIARDAAAIRGWTRDEGKDICDRHRPPIPQGPKGTP